MCLSHVNKIAEQSELLGSGLKRLIENQWALSQVRKGGKIGGVAPAKFRRLHVKSRDVYTPPLAGHKKSKITGFKASIALLLLVPPSIQAADVLCVVNTNRAEVLGQSVAWRTFPDVQTINILSTNWHSVTVNGVNVTMSGSIVTNRFVVFHFEGQAYGPYTVGQPPSPLPLSPPLPMRFK